MIIIVSSSHPISTSLSPAMQALIPATSSTLTPSPLLQNRTLVAFKRSYKQHLISTCKKKKTAAASCKSSSSDFPGGVNLRNLERAIKLQSAISNKSVRQFMELIGDECRYCFEDLNLQPLQLTKKALEMLHSLLVKNNVMLVIKPTEGYGVDIGIRWITSLAREKLPLGFGCSISTTHFYEGVVFLKNVKNVISVLAQMKIAQKLEERVLPVLADKLLPKGVLNEKERIALIYSLLSVAVMVVSVIIFKNM